MNSNDLAGIRLIAKDFMRYGSVLFIINDKHHSEQNRGIATWKTNPSALIVVAEQAQARFGNQKETFDLMEYFRPPAGRGTR